MRNQEGAHNEEESKGEGSELKKKKKGFFGKIVSGVGSVFKPNKDTNKKK